VAIQQKNPAEPQPMSNEFKFFLEQLAQQILEKFFSSYKTSSLVNTNKAAKILPSIINYSKGEITKRSNKYKSHTP